MILPACVSFALAVACINESITYTGVAFVEMLGSTACFFAAILSVLLGLPFQVILLSPMVLVAGGSCAAALGELNFSVIGLLLILSSNCFMALTSVLQQKLMTTGSGRGKYDPCTLAFWSSIPSAFLLFGISLMSEGLEPFRYLIQAETSKRLSMSLEIMLYCTLFVCMTLTSNFVVREMGGVGFFMMVMAAGILTVLGGIVLFNEVVTMSQFAGYAVMLMGVSWFNIIQNAGKGSDLDKEEEKEEGAEAAEGALVGG